jgi:hypothetical protein
VKGKRTTQLFDLEDDPLEFRNLVNTRDYVPHFQRLRKELLRWKDELGDKSTFWEGYYRR